MNINQLRIIDAPWHDYQSQLQLVRRLVFIEEQNIAEHDEWDEHDHSSQHLLAMLGEQAIACVRIVHYIQDNNTHVKITRLAVIKDYRQQGIGTQLLRKATQVALSHQPKQLYLHAQLSAAALYKRWEFSAEGEIFNEAGIDHQKMIFDCNNTSNIASVFGSDIQRLETSKQWIHFFKLLASQAHRELYISSECLRSDIFASEIVLDAISAFARRDRHSQVKILVNDNSYLSERAAHLIHLSRRLSSKIHIKILNEQTEQPLGSFCLFDRRGLAYFNDENTTLGFVCFDAKAECKKLHNEFIHSWEQQSHSDPNTAQLSL